MGGNTDLGCGKEGWLPGGERGGGKAVVGEVAAAAAAVPPPVSSTAARRRRPKADVAAFKRKHSVNPVQKQLDPVSASATSVVVCAPDYSRSDRSHQQRRPHGEEEEAPLLLAPSARAHVAAKQIQDVNDDDADVDDYPCGRGKKRRCPSARCGIRRRGRIGANASAYPGERLSAQSLSHDCPSRSTSTIAPLPLPPRASTTAVGSPAAPVLSSRFIASVIARAIRRIVMNGEARKWRAHGAAAAAAAAASSATPQLHAQSPDDVGRNASFMAPPSPHAPLGGCRDPATPQRCSCSSPALAAFHSACAAAAPGCGRVAGAAGFYGGSLDDLMMMEHSSSTRMFAAPARTSPLTLGSAAMGCGLPPPLMHLPPASPPMSPQRRGSGLTGSVVVAPLDGFDSALTTPIDQALAGATIPGAVVHGRYARIEHDEDDDEDDELLEFITAIAKDVHMGDAGPVVFIAAMVYLSRIARSADHHEEHCTIGADNFFRLSVCAVLVASKMYLEHYSRKLNKRVAECAKIPLGELSAMEVEFLHLVDFSLLVQEVDFEDYIAWLEEIADDEGDALEDGGGEANANEEDLRVIQQQQQQYQALPPNAIAGSAAVGTWVLGGVATLSPSMSGTRGSRPFTPMTPQSPPHRSRGGGGGGGGIFHPAATPPLSPMSHRPPTRLLSGAGARGRKPVELPRGCTPRSAASQPHRSFQQSPEHALPAFEAIGDPLAPSPASFTDTLCDSIRDVIRHSFSALGSDPPRLHSPSFATSSPVAAAAAAHECGSGKQRCASQGRAAELGGAMWSHGASSGGAGTPAAAVGSPDPEPHASTATPKCGGKLFTHKFCENGVGGIEDEVGACCPAALPPPMDLLDDLRSPPPLPHHTPFVSGERGQGGGVGVPAAAAAAAAAAPEHHRRDASRGEWQERDRSGNGSRGEDSALLHSVLQRVAAAASSKHCSLPDSSDESPISSDGFYFGSPSPHGASAGGAILATAPAAPPRRREGTRHCDPANSSLHSAAALPRQCRSVAGVAAEGGMPLPFDATHRPSVVPPAVMRGDEGERSTMGGPSRSRGRDPSSVDVPGTLQFFSPTAACAEPGNVGNPGQQLQQRDADGVEHVRLLLPVETPSPPDSAGGWCGLSGSKLPDGNGNNTEAVSGESPPSPDGHGECDPEQQGQGRASLPLRPSPPCWGGSDALDDGDDDGGDYGDYGCVAGSAVPMVPDAHAQSFRNSTGTGLIGVGLAVPGGEKHAPSPQTRPFMRAGFGCAQIGSEYGCQHEDQSQGEEEEEEEGWCQRQQRRERQRRPSM